MSVLLDARPHAAAIKAALEATIGPDPDTDATRVFDYDEVPGGNDEDGEWPDGLFVLIGIERRSNPVLRTPGRAGSAGWRVSFRSVGRDASEARWAQFQVAQALAEQRLLVAEKHTSRLQLESSDAPAYDDGRYSATDLYTYTH